LATRKDRPRWWRLTDHDRGFQVLTHRTVWTQVPGGEVAAVVVKEAAVAQDEGPRVAQSDLYADFDLFPLLDKIRAVLYSEDC
jgi:hypothetical protein